MIDFGGVALMGLMALVALVAPAGVASSLPGARCAATAPIRFAQLIIRMSSAYSAISRIVARSCRDGAPELVPGISAV